MKPTMIFVAPLFCKADREFFNSVLSSFQFMFVSLLFSLKVSKSDGVELGLVHTYILGCLRVEHFSLPIGDINSPHKNEFIEGIVFFQKVTKPLGRPL